MNLRESNFISKVQVSNEGSKITDNRYWINNRKVMSKKKKLSNHRYQCILMHIAMKICSKSMWMQERIIVIGQKSLRIKSKNS